MSASGRAARALPELGESALEPLLLVLRQRFPLAHEKRPWLAA